ncbi:hypothetical protein [Sphingomonas sp. NPDC079357]|uniref:hypothetical protein n=1 Tax=Sphingomonas sp. NPDC079357 TaxID=3364518 RepID=UPI00384B3BE0
MRERTQHSDRQIFFHLSSIVDIMQAAQSFRRNSARHAFRLGTGLQARFARLALPRTSSMIDVNDPQAIKEESRQSPPLLLRLGEGGAANFTTRQSSCLSVYADQRTHP